MKMLITREWLRKKLLNSPDLPCEAGIMHPDAPRQVWLSKCAKRYEEKALLMPETAYEMAEACLENLGGDLTESPIEAADEDMSCWTE